MWMRLGFFFGVSFCIKSNQFGLAYDLFQLTTQMAASVTLFSFNREIYSLLGNHAVEPNREGIAFNSRNWLFMISLILFALPSAAFFTFEAKSMLDYVISFYCVSSVVFSMCMYMAMVWRAKNTWPFFENCKRFIERSKYLIVKSGEIGVGKCGL